jgi:hypothetical protein
VKFEGAIELRHMGVASLSKAAWHRAFGARADGTAMANHSNTRTTQLHSRRRDKKSLDEVERIRV